MSATGPKAEQSTPAEQGRVRVSNFRPSVQICTCRENTAALPASTAPQRQAVRCHHWSHTKKESCPAVISIKSPNRAAIRSRKMKKMTGIASDVNRALSKSVCLDVFSILIAFRATENLYSYYSPPECNNKRTVPKKSFLYRHGNCRSDAVVISAHEYRIMYSPR